MSRAPTVPPKLYWGTAVTRRLIREYARRIGEQFQPDRIILFGSHAYGTPHADSDVDLLVIMPTRNLHSQSVKIRWELPAPFPLDLLVRTPRQIADRLKEGESFTTEVLKKGRVLYEKADAGVGAEGRGRLSGGHRARRKA